MEPEEFEVWFEQEKERLSEEFKKKLDAGGDFKKLKKDFHKKFTDLLKKYKTNYDKNLKKEKRRKMIHEPLEKMSQEIDKLVDTFKEKT